MDWKNGFTVEVGIHVLHLNSAGIRLDLLCPDLPVRISPKSSRRLGLALISYADQIDADHGGPDGPPPDDTYEQARLESTMSGEQLKALAADRECSAPRADEPIPYAMTDEHLSTSELQAVYAHMKAQAAIHGPAWAKLAAYMESTPEPCDQCNGSGVIELLFTTAPCVCRGGS